MSTSLRGLQQATNPHGFDPSEDPTGIALMARARQNRFQYQTEHPESMMSGPLPDPRWDAWLQAVSEAGNGRPVKFNAAGFNSSPNIANDPTSTFNTTGGPFGQFGTGTGGIEDRPPDNSMAGLQQAVKRSRGLR